MTRDQSLFLVLDVFAIWAWFVFMMLFRFLYFDQKGGRKVPVPFDTKKEVFDKLKYDGEATYKDLDMFVKLSLAIFGGIAYAALSDQAKNNPGLVKELISLALWLQLLIAIVTTIFVLSHKRSAFLHWKRRPVWWEVFTWGDTWGYVLGMSLSLYSFLVGGPMIAGLIK